MTTGSNEHHHILYGKVQNHLPGSSVVSWLIKFSHKCKIIFPQMSDRFFYLLLLLFWFCILLLRSIDRSMENSNMLSSSGKIDLQDTSFDDAHYRPATCHSKSRSADTSLQFHIILNWSGSVNLDQSGGGRVMTVEYMRERREVKNEVIFVLRFKWQYCK